MKKKQEPEKVTEGNTVEPKRSKRNTLIYS